MTEPPAPPPDSYEAQYMGAQGALHRSKKPMPWWFLAAQGAALLTVVVTAVTSGQWALLLMVPALAVVSLLFSHLRVVVTPEHVHVQLGLFGPKIAVSAIERVSAEDYRAIKYGGWGIRFGVDGSVAYSIPGGTGRGVRIEYRGAKGNAKAVFVSSNEAEALAAAIEDARAARASGVRVAPGELAGGDAAGESVEADAAARVNDARARK